MKKVIFICLLTLSVCFSQPAGPANNTTTDAGAQKPSNTVPKDTKSTDPPKPTENPGNHTEATTLPPAGNVTVPSHNDTGKNGTTVAPAHGNITSTTTVTPPSSTASTTVTTPTPHPPTPKPANHTTISSTVPPPPLQARGFDGASFVGGIILTLGLLAIGFMGFRYYKTQTERNYHTL